MGKTLTKVCFQLTYFFNDGAPYHLETSSLICRANDRDLCHERVKMVKEDTYNSTTAIYPSINEKNHVAIHGSQDKKMRLKNRF